MEELMYKTIIFLLLIIHSFQIFSQTTNCRENKSNDNEYVMTAYNTKQINYSGGPDLRPAFVLIGFIAITNYIIPEYIMDYHNNTVNNGLIWQFPFGIPIGERMHILIPSYYKFPGN
jgi:hypothetical protein